MQNLTVLLDDQPGALAEVGEVLGQNGIDVAGLCGFPTPPGGTIHILVEDAIAARGVLEPTGASVRDVRDVLVIDAEDRPGVLGAVARTLADAGVNIDLIYLTADSRIVIGAGNRGAAERALGMNGSKRRGKAGGADELVMAHTA